MSKTNEYSASIKRLPEEKLREYILNPENYHDDAILAAIWELEKRRPIKSDEKALEKEISSKISTTDNIKIQESESNPSYTQQQLPNLYSIRSIQVFSVLFSVFAGGILMAINFNRTANKVEVYKVIGFSLSYSILATLFFTVIGAQSPLFSIAFNLLGAFLIDELFWKRVLGREFKFNKQQVWTALIVGLIIISPLVYYLYINGALPVI